LQPKPPADKNKNSRQFKRVPIPKLNFIPSNVGEKSKESRGQEEQEELADSSLSNHFS
jgi:hypothetical protein